MNSTHGDATASSERFTGTSTTRERMRDAAVDRVREVARDRDAILTAIEQGQRTDLDEAWQIDVGTEAAPAAMLPALVVPKGFTRAVRRMLIATDFSETSLCAARAALALAPAACAHLVHVCPKGWCCAPGTIRAAAPRDGQIHARCSSPAGPVDPLDTFFDALFDACEATLQTPPARFTRAVIAGDPSCALLDYALERDIDLIAVGIHGHASVHGKALGAVAERILREAQCSVLVTGLAVQPEHRVLSLTARPVVV